MYYFGSGPAAFPEEVLKEAAEKIVRHHGKELSVLEIPHRGRVFQEMVEESEALVKSLLQLGDDYEVCWMHGGGRAQFALIPMNFLTKEDTAGFIDSGHWADEAQKFAAFYGNTKIIASAANEGYTCIPEWKELPNNLTYLHLTSNNTLYGTQFKHFPETHIPLVVDMTSELFSREINYNQFSLIYAAAQKNIGPAGVTLVIVKKDFLARQKNNLPGIFSYQDLFKAHSVYNTPPVFAIYCSLLYLRWTAKIGLEEIAKRNKEKAAMLYEAIEESNLFHCKVEKEHRSEMNVCFYAQSPDQEAAFIDFARQSDITGIKGHRSVGGLRVALYNAIRPEEVAFLVKVMKQFEQHNG